jgi:hypothetical protein
LIQKGFWRNVHDAVLHRIWKNAVILTSEVHPERLMTNRVGKVPDVLAIQRRGEKANLQSIEP